jgi:CBS domain-containing protein/tetratricopeptide (TPR) repeat protein
MSLRTLGHVVQRSGGAVSVSDSVSVYDLAHALKAHAVDAAAVLASDGTLAGIATASDVARAVARADPPRSTSVSSAMTVHPTMLPPDETPANALNLMRTGLFRHLPVVDPSTGAVLGIVDVLHLAYDAIVRLQAAYGLVPTRRTFAFMRAARDTIEKPTLRQFLQRKSQFTALLPDHTALDACEALVRNHAAAVIVVDQAGMLEGIFTCRDVAARVVAAGLDPGTTLLRHVMTPRPDFALPDFTILECLQRMQACGFRHLPVVDEASRKVIGLVDVLQLASDALMGGLDSEVERSMAESGTPTSASQNANGLSSIFASLWSSSGLTGSLPEMSPDGTPLTELPASQGGNARLSGPGSPRANLHNPLSSTNPRRLSAGNRQVSTLSTADLNRMRQAASPMSNYHFTGGGLSTNASTTRAHSIGTSSVLAAAAATAGLTEHQQQRKDMVTFKFKDCEGEYRRVKMARTISPGIYDQLVVDVRRRFFNTASSSFKSTSAVRIKYIDEDGDPVVIASDDDVAACFDECHDNNVKTIKLWVSEAPANSMSSSHNEPSPVSSRASSRPSSSSHSVTNPDREALVTPPDSKSGSITTRQHRRTSVDLTSVDVSAVSLAVNTDAAHADLRARSESLSPAISSPGTASPSTMCSFEAHALMMDQHVAAAISKYDEALTLNKGNARALCGRGAAKLISGDASSAEGDYRASLAIIEAVDGDVTGSSCSDICRTYDMCVVGLVEVLIEQRRYEEASQTSFKLKGRPAIAGCADALRDELDGSSEAAASALGSSEFGEAMALFSNAIRVETAFLAVSTGQKASASLRNGRGKCYLAVNDFEMALEDFEAARAADPESVAAFKGCGKCLLELERFDASLDAYESAAELDAGDDEVHEKIATLKKVMTDPQDAKKEAIAKLGALLGGMNLPTTLKTGSGDDKVGASARRAKSTLSGEDVGTSSGSAGGDTRGRRRKVRGKRVTTALQ